MIWLTREQIAVLFGRDYKTISKHINNALREELADSVVVAKFANTTQHGAIKGKMQTHMIDYFNLEVITSVGYRVKSKRGVQFRQWANRVLKEYLVKGYAVNERLRHEQIGELRQLVDVLGRTIQSQPVLQMAESEALFEVVTDYAYALDTLDNYDYERLAIDKTTKENLSMPLMRMLWRNFSTCVRSSAVLPCSVMRKMSHSKATSDRFTKPLVVRNFTPVWRKRLQCYSISSQRIIHSVMVTNE